MGESRGKGRGEVGIVGEEKGGGALREWW